MIESFHVQNGIWDDENHARSILFISLALKNYKLILQQMRLEENIFCKFFLVCIKKSAIY